jgi:DNA-directed RNA polymerase subunit H (RpoH/RPB5)
VHVQLDSDQLDDAVVRELALKDQGVQQPAAKDQDPIVVAAGDESGQVVPVSGKPLDRLEKVGADELRPAGQPVRGA